jgi:uncharacterized protein YjbI with pentapeptide repeats
MAQREQLEHLEEGVGAWNTWRRANPQIRPDLRQADIGERFLNLIDLSGADLRGVDLGGTHLRGAVLRHADLSGAHLYGASLIAADLSYARLVEANLALADLIDAVFIQAVMPQVQCTGAQAYGSHFSGADLRRADFQHADLTRSDFSRAHLNTADMRQACLVRADFTQANLGEADLSNAVLRQANLHQTQLHGAVLNGADFAEAHLLETYLINMDLTDAQNLETCYFHGPSTLDIRTLARAKQLPRAFLQGCGWPDYLINLVPPCLPMKQSIALYLCYAAKDERLALKVFQDLQLRGIRCWLAPGELKEGARFGPVLQRNESANVRQILILSQYSVGCSWLEQKVEEALAELNNASGAKK